MKLLSSINESSDTANKEYVDYRDAYISSTINTKLENTDLVEYTDSEVSTLFNTIFTAYTGS